MHNGHELIMRSSYSVTTNDITKYLTAKWKLYRHLNIKQFK